MIVFCVLTVIFIIFDVVVSLLEVEKKKIFFFTRVQRRNVTAVRRPQVLYS